MARLWWINGDRVMRGGREIARIVTEDGKRGWVGLDMRRIGFSETDDEAILADVKYFHRVHPPALTLHFKSGRKVTFR